MFPLLISKDQSSYVEGQKFLDGITVVHGFIHTMKKFKKSSMVIKLDLSKEFDKLSLAYIIQILKAFGFSNDWDKWVALLSPSLSLISLSMA